MTFLSEWEINRPGEAEGAPNRSVRVVGRNNRPAVREDFLVENGDCDFVADDGARERSDARDAKP